MDDEDNHDLNFHIFVSFDNGWCNIIIVGVS